METAFHYDLQQRQLGFKLRERISTGLGIELKSNVSLGTHRALQSSRLRHTWGLGHLRGEGPPRPIGRSRPQTRAAGHLQHRHREAGPPDDLEEDPRHGQGQQGRREHPAHPGCVVRGPCSAELGFACRRRAAGPGPHPTTRRMRTSVRAMGRAPCPNPLPSCRAGEYNTGAPQHPP